MVLIILCLSLEAHSLKVFSYEPPDPLGSLIQSRKRVLELEIRRKSEFLKRNYGLDLLSPFSSLSDPSKGTGKQVIEPPRKAMDGIPKRPNNLTENRSLTGESFRFIEREGLRENISGLISSMKTELETRIFSVISGNLSRVESSVESLVKTLNSTIKTGGSPSQTASNEEALREILQKLGNEGRGQRVNNTEIESFLQDKIRSEFSRYFELLPKNSIPTEEKPSAKALKASKPRVLLRNQPSLQSSLEKGQKSPDSHEPQ